MAGQRETAAVMTAVATPVTVHQQRPPKANVNEPLIYAVSLKKESVTTNSEGVLHILKKAK
jgi:hypothetical protein